MMKLISFGVMMIFSLVGVAFLTLLERKILGYLQIRKGPAKVGLQGLFQPFSDAVKLFSKESMSPLKSNLYPYWLSPFFMLIISLIVWSVFPYFTIILSWKFSFMFMLSILSVGVYCIMISGWSSNSNYAMMGCIRVIAQSISYEVSFFLLILSMIYLTKSLNMVDFSVYQYKIWFIVFMMPIFFMMFISFLAELNRTPFDFSEGESELVSGFNIEYAGVGFAFIFLAEYLSILFSSVVLSLLFMGGWSVSFLFYIKVLIVSIIIIIIRGALPRYRYDKLMNLCWKIYLSSTLFLIIFYMSIMF